FQAEDGIRDRNVTGVQTCALPISVAEIPTTGPESPPLQRLRQGCGLRAGGRDLGHGARSRGVRGLERPDERVEAAFVAQLEHARSEERRVGKAGGWRGSPRLHNAE